MEPPCKKLVTGPGMPEIILFTNPKDEKKGWCRQKFREEWCSEPEFDGWLEPVPDDPFRAWCKCCQCTLSVGRSELLKHAQTQKHKRAMQDANSANKVLTILDGAPSTGNFSLGVTSEIGRSAGLSSGQHALSVKGMDEHLLKAELSIAAFAVEHDLSGRTVQHLSDLIDALVERPEILAKLQVGRNKCASLVKNVLAKSVQHELDEILKQRLFSIILEEPREVPGWKVFCVIVRYFNESRNRSTGDLFEAFAIEESELTAEVLVELIKDKMLARKIPLQNLIGVAADRSSLIYSDLSLLKTELFPKNDDAVIFNCTCRSMTVVACHAVTVLPQGLRQLMFYFGSCVVCSAKHYGSLVGSSGMPQNVAEVRKLFSMLDSSQWLANPMCINLLSERLTELAAVLEAEVTEGKSPIAALLYQETTNPYTKAYLLFLNYVLALVYGIEEFFKSERVMIHNLLKDCQNQFRVICQHFMTPSAFMVDDLTSVSAYSEQNLLLAKDVFVGSECQEFIKDLEADQNEEFLEHCRSFFQVVVSEIQNRIPLDSVILEYLTFLDPDVALRSEGRTFLQSVCKLGSTFPKHINSTKLDTQWMSLASYFSTLDVEELKKMPVDSMWGIISAMRNTEDELVFGELGKLAKLSLSLPFSDGDVARISSMLSAVYHEGKYGNPNHTLQTILPLKNAMKQDGLDCHKLRITARHRKFYSLEIAKKEEFPDHSDLFGVEHD